MSLESQDVIRIIQGKQVPKEIDEISKNDLDHFKKHMYRHQTLQN